MPVSEKDRLYWIDAIRSFACLCVLVMHSLVDPYFFKGCTALMANHVYLFIATGGASVLFFMISGALVLYRPKPALPFFKRRLLRIGVPVVIWSVVQLVASVLRHHIDWHTCLLNIPQILISAQKGQYWFIYVLFGIYLMTPILAAWLDRCTRRELEVYLGIWAVTLATRYFSHAFPPINILVEYEHGYLYYFFGYLWFAVLGYYLRRYVNIPNFGIKHFALLLLCLVVAITSPLWLRRLGVPFELLTDRMTLHFAVSGMCYFLILKHLTYGPRLRHRLYIFAQYSFGIYLVHTLITRPLIWPFFSDCVINVAVMVPVVAVVIAAVSFLVVHLISKLPGSKYIVGV